MTLYDTKFWMAIDKARLDLGGESYYDYETDTEYKTPAKDAVEFYSAHEYFGYSWDAFFKITEIIDEVKLIQTQIQHSQDFSLNHKEFSTDFVLNFSYKNWILRINIISEQLIDLVNHIYQLKLSKKDLINRIFKHPKLLHDSVLFNSLKELIDYMYENILLEANIQSIKRARNQIVHNGNFKHKTINYLSASLALYNLGISDKDEEDSYLDQGQASEKIKNEILSFTIIFLNKLLLLYDLFGIEFSKNLDTMMKKNTS